MMCATMEVSVLMLMLIEVFKLRTARSVFTVAFYLLLLRAKAGTGVRALGDRGPGGSGTGDRGLGARGDQGLAPWRLGTGGPGHRGIAALHHAV